MRRALALTLLLVAAAAACSSDTEAPLVEGDGIRLVEVGRFDSPSALAARPGSDELWVADDPLSAPDA